MHFTLSELLLDLVQNAAEAGARTIRVEWGETDGGTVIAVDDDGHGMAEDVVARVTDPFYTDGIKHPGRPVGLGLAFLRQTAEATGGRFSVASTPGRGTRVELEAPADHVDLPPTGDAAEAVVIALCTESPDEIEVIRHGPFGSYAVRKTDMVDVLGELARVEARVLLIEYVRSQEDEIWQR